MLASDQRMLGMALATMQKANLDTGTVEVHGRISRKTVELDGIKVMQMTFGPGARWSTDLRPDVGTELCQSPHVALVLAGTLHVELQDGSVQEFSGHDVMMIPPGHDAWSVGDQPCVFVEFSRGDDYYTS
jgi:hypothetical protein